MFRILTVLSLLGAGAAVAGGASDDDYDRYVKLAEQPAESAPAPSNVWPARMAQIAGGLLMETAVVVGGGLVGDMMCTYCGLLTGPLLAPVGAYLGVQLTGLLFGRRANDG